MSGSWLRAVGGVACLLAGGFATPWDAAVAGRAAFEAEAVGTHTRAEYARVMDGFRGIYHADPGDAHAARAVEQVAELLAEEGREFSDAKALGDARGQYLFLGKAYPGYAKRAEAGVASLGDSGKSSGERSVAAATDTPPFAKAQRMGHPEVVAPMSPKARDMGHPEVEDAPAVLASVTGIRHWSTASYTRVAIDLGDAVEYQAARVENPDRIFFDLHHARLAPQLAGKSFAVTDDGFLTRIRAAQFSEDVTRVVLDVSGVAEYSAFLLPNPYRLIIDIHGRQETGNRKEETGSGDGGATAPVVRVVPEMAQVSAQPGTKEAREAKAAVSSLPPTPVTDGSAGFGLPARSGAAAGGVVAPPRVVVSSKPTVAKPVPNSVTTVSGATKTEVAAVSEQPGKVEATARPTSGPVVSRSRKQETGNGEQGSGNRKQETGNSEQVSSVSEVARGDHYRKPGVVGGGAESGRERSVATATDAHPNDETVRVGHPEVEKPVIATGRTLKAAPVEGAGATADGEVSLVRALGLKIGRIVIDAGHGGHDSGTLGVGGIQEKDVVLDVALRLGKLLHERLGAEIVYTRADDTFIPLETRTAIANKAQADLFISVHANSSQDESARGVEVYYLNFTSDPDAMKVASRENAVSTQSVHELSDLVKKIALKDKIEESKELASDVDASLYGGLTKGNAGLKDRGVKKAPFVVLIGANMPSILAEISFVTNGEDAEQLSSGAYRERVAESIYAGVARYAAGVNGVKGKTVVAKRK